MSDSSATVLAYVISFAVMLGYTARTVIAVHSCSKELARMSMERQQEAFKPSVEAEIKPRSSIRVS